VCLKVHKEVKSTVSGDIAFQTFTTLLSEESDTHPDCYSLVEDDDELIEVSTINEHGKNFDLINLQRGEST